MYYRIIDTGTIQLSENYIGGYRPVVVDEKPAYNKATHHLESFYTINDNAIHQSWNIEEGEDELTADEALAILKGQGL